MKKVVALHYFENIHEHFVTIWVHSNFKQWELLRHRALFQDNVSC